MSKPRAKEALHKGVPITGVVVGGWKVLGPSEKDPTRRLLMECVTCGKVVEKSRAVFAPTASPKTPRGCISCYNKAKKARKELNPNWRGSTSGNISGTVLQKIRMGANRRSRQLDVDVDAEYLDDLMNKQQWKCAYSGRSLYFGSGDNESGGTASLDRTDSSKGYVKGNVKWVHIDVNRAKWELDENEFIQLCKDVCEWSVQAPIEPISKEEYERRVASTRLIASINSAADFGGVDDCVSGACPVR